MILRGKTGKRSVHCLMFAMKYCCPSVLVIQKKTFIMIRSIEMEL